MNKFILMIRRVLTVTGLLTVLFSVSLRAQNLTVEQNSSLISAKQGAVVKLPNYLNSGRPVPRLDYQKVILPGPQFIISDDPEYIRVPEAVALREDVQPGLVRLYLYNVNGVKTPNKIDRKITAIIKNTGPQQLHLRMLKYSSQKPGTNYFKIGKEGMADYFAASPQSMVRTIKPGKALTLDQKLEHTVVKYDELVHGIYEFVIDQPAEISVIQTDPHTPGVKALNTVQQIMAPKSHSGAGRGLYGTANYQIRVKDTYDTKNGPGEVLVADGTLDPWIEGYEKTTGQQVKDVGNYGVIYEIEMKWKSTDGKGLALVTWNPRCGSMSAAMVVSKGKFDAGIIQLPSDSLITKGAPEVILVQVFPPAKNGMEQTLKITYSPPAAGCLPTPLVFIPVDLKN